MDREAIKNRSATRKATFAAGCFWGVEEAFGKVPGIISTTVGYTGGITTDPTYEDVCTGRTGHAEAVELEYDPGSISYSELLDMFWKMHDPTTPNSQGWDIGTQYRSAIFCHDEEQRTEAMRSKKVLEEEKRYTRPIVTIVEKAGPFFPAEEYHQGYYRKRGIVGCSFSGGGF